MASRLSELRIIGAKLGARAAASGEEDELKSIYYDLSRCLDSIQEALIHLEDVGERVCLAVLEDDVSDLLEECGELMFGGDDAVSSSVKSLESRTSTVLEELSGLLDVRTRPMPN